MKRYALLALCVFSLIGGCAEPQWPSEPQRPKPGPEMETLKKLVGNWTGTARIVCPSPEEMKKHMPEGSPEMPSEFKGESHFEMGLGGLFLKGMGWHEMGNNEKSQFEEYWMWDPSENKYRTWYFSDLGEYGTGCAWYCPKCQTFVFEAEGGDMSGGEMTGSGSMTVVDAEHLTWTWCEEGRMGKICLEGSSTRKK